jgi:hypothetical protein
MIIAAVGLAGCGSYLRNPPVPQQPWTPTMSQPSRPASQTHINELQHQSSQPALERLEELETLRQRNLVTEQEYQLKRQRILDDL